MAKFTAQRSMRVKSGFTAVAEFELRKGDGTLILRGSSDSLNDFWGRLYDAQRIRYCQRRRKAKIPEFYRTGERPKHLLRQYLLLLIRNIPRE